MEIVNSKHLIHFDNCDVKELQTVRLRKLHNFSINVAFVITKCKVLKS